MENLNMYELIKRINDFTQGIRIDNLEYNKNCIIIYGEELFGVSSNISKDAAKKTLYIYEQILNKKCSTQDIQVIAANIESIEDIKKNNLKVYQVLSESVKKDKVIEEQITKMKAEQMALTVIDKPFSKILNFFKRTFTSKKPNIEFLEMQIAGTGKYVSASIKISEILLSRNAIEDFQMVEEKIQEMELQTHVTSNTDEIVEEKIKVCKVK